MFLFDTQIIADAITKASTPLWLTVVLTLLPLLFSLYVICRQNKIMEKQNDIALFDKKYEVYMEYDQFCRNYDNLIKIPKLFAGTKNNLECEKFNYLFDRVIGYDSDVINDNPYCEVINGLFVVITPFIKNLDKIPLLFNIDKSDLVFIEDLREEIIKIYGEAIKFCCDKESTFKENLDCFLANKIDCTFKDKIKKQININHKKNML